MFKYVSKSVEVKYDSGLHYRIDYIDNEKLKWTDLGTGIDGAPAFAIESYYWSEISENVFTINWIEESGISVSQVINFNTLEVYSFIAWNNAAFRGNREFLINTGKVKLL